MPLFLIGEKMQDSSELLKEYSQAKKAVEKFSARWNDFINLAYAKIPEGNNFKSRVSTGDLANLLIERNARVASKVPSGKIVPMSRDDGRKANALNLAWQNYILERADWQYPMPIKLRMWDYYSLVYGISVMFHGYRVDEKYVGPDCRLIDLRFIFPEAGRLSPNDVNYVFYETFHSKKELESMIGQDGWNEKNLKSLLSEKASSNVESSQLSSILSERGENEELYQGLYKLITKYQKGKGATWTTFDSKGNIIRQVPNPFESGRIPFAFKVAFPLVDSFWGLGDIERGESLQKAINTVTNLSLDYLKTLIFPPVMMSRGMNRSQYPFKPAAQWLLDRASGEFVEVANLNQAPAGITQQLNQAFKGSLLNQNGTTDTTVGRDAGLPQFGKTPEALKKLSERENSRDNFDRQMYEEACQELFEGMLEELSTRQELPIEFAIFEEEIAKIENEGWGENLQKINADYGRFRLNPEDLRGGFKFRIEAGSSIENDEKEEFERVQKVIEMIESAFGQKAIEEMEKRGETLDYKLIFEQYLASSNVVERDKMIIPKKAEDMGDKKPWEQNFSENMITDPNLQNMMGGQNG